MYFNRMNATQLRQNLYQTLDEIIETGKPVRVERKGKVLFITAEPTLKQKRVFKKRKVFKNSGEDITKIDWMKDWEKKWDRRLNS